MTMNLHYEMLGTGHTDKEQFVDVEQEIQEILKIGENIIIKAK